MVAAASPTSLSCVRGDVAEVVVADVNLNRGVSLRPQCI